MHRVVDGHVFVSVDQNARQRLPGGLVEQGLVRELGGLAQRLLALAQQRQLPVRAHVDVQGLGVGQAWWGI